MASPSFYEKFPPALPAGKTRDMACRERGALCVKALVTFDYAQPALWLGAALISGGVFLLNLRNVQPVSSKDSDIVLSCILVFSGGILIFQVPYSSHTQPWG